MPIKNTLEILEKEYENNVKKCERWKTLDPYSNLAGYYEGRCDVLKFAIELIKTDLNEVKENA